MTKDEAFTEQAKGLHDRAASRQECFYAGWDAACADLLTLLEEQVGQRDGDEITIRRFHADGGNTIVGMLRQKGELIWWGGRFAEGGRVVSSIYTRAEAEALLAGKEKNSG